MMTMNDNDKAIVACERHYSFRFKDKEKAFHYLYQQFVQL